MELIVNDDWVTFTTSIYVKEYRGNQTIIIGQKDGQLIEHILDRTLCRVEPIEPLLKMPRGMADEFIKSIVDYASNKNIKTVNENLMQGKLAATEKHLEDMRNGFTKLLDKVIAQ